MLKNFYPYSTFPSLLKQNTQIHLNFYVNYNSFHFMYRNFTLDHIHSASFSYYILSFEAAQPT